MNNLSWLLYAADISEKLSYAFIFGVVGALTWALFGTIIHHDLTGQIKVPKFAIPTAIGCGLFAAILPSSNTVYAIAASEMGEEVLQSATTTKAMKALDAWLDRQIAPEQPAN